MLTDEQRFLKACDVVTKKMQRQDQMHQIGTLGEKTLHAVVKYYIEPDDAKHEVKVGSFYADIAADDAVVEVHTRSFNTLRKKLAAFMETSPVTVVYPLPKTKWLLWIDNDTGEVTKKRKSPKIGRLYDAFHELYKIKPLLRHENFRLHLIFIDVEEYRYLDGWGENKKRGSSRCDRIPVGLKEEYFFNVKNDYLQFIPNTLPIHFTTKDYKTETGINLPTSQTALNILYHLGVIKRIGKQGNLHVYERESEDKERSPCLRHICTEDKNDSR